MGCCDSKPLTKDKMSTPQKKSTEVVTHQTAENLKKNELQITEKNKSEFFASKPVDASIKTIKTPNEFKQEEFSQSTIDFKPTIGQSLIKSKNPRKAHRIEPDSIFSIPILQENLVEERLTRNFDRDYDMLNLLGTGSFGSVYKIKKKGY